MFRARIYLPWVHMLHWTTNPVNIPTLTAYPFPVFAYSYQNLARQPFTAFYCIYHATPASSQNQPHVLIHRQTWVLPSTSYSLYKQTHVTLFRFISASDWHQIILTSSCHQEQIHIKDSKSAKVKLGHEESLRDGVKPTRAQFTFKNPSIIYFFKNKRNSVIKNIMHFLQSFHI